jgi:hypothetical protein
MCRYCSPPCLFGRWTGAGVHWHGNVAFGRADALQASDVAQRIQTPTALGARTVWQLRAIRQFIGQQNALEDSRFGLWRTLVCFPKASIAHHAIVAHFYYSIIALVGQYGAVNRTHAQ